jgi:hypothetical protein
LLAKKNHYNKRQFSEWPWAVSTTITSISSPIKASHLSISLLTWVENKPRTIDSLGEKISLKITGLPADMLRLFANLGHRVRSCMDPGAATFSTLCDWGMYQQHLITISA